MLGIGERLKGRSDSVPLGEIVDALGPAAIGMLLIVLTLPALIPLPGPFGMVFGTMLILISTQLMFGVRRLWLPAIVRRRLISVHAVARMVDTGVPILVRAEARLKPRRLLPLTGRTARVAMAVPLVLLSLTIALPIPFGNILPGLSMIAMALGIVMRDGIAILVGLGLATLAWLWTTVILIFGSELVGRLMALFGW